MATIAQDLARARKLTETTPVVADDGVPPLEVVAAERDRSEPAAGIYARHSSSKQKSIPAQIHVCRERCEQRGWAVRYELKDHGRSATDPDREAFNQMMVLIESEAIDVLVVWKIDRIVRNLAQAAVLNEFAQEHGVAIHSVVEPIDTTTPIGRFIFGILANAAQLELDMIKERVTMGIEQRTREGRWPRPHVPFGYRRTKGNYLRVEPSEAKVVRAIFDKYLEHKSAARVAMALADDFPDSGIRWTEDRVRQILSNPIYKGLIAIGGVECVRQRIAIIRPQTWAQVEDLRRQSTHVGKPLGNKEKEAAIDRVFEQYLASLEGLD